MYIEKYIKICLKRDNSGGYTIEYAYEKHVLGCNATLCFLHTNCYYLIVFSFRINMLRLQNEIYGRPPGTSL